MAYFLPFEPISIFSLLMFEVIFLYLKGLIRITTVNEKNAITKSTGKIPTTPEKLDKKLALIKKIGVIVRKIAREQAKPETIHLQSYKGL